MGEDLIERRLESLSIVEETVDAERLDEGQMSAWLKVLNDLRLVLGTMLDIQEDQDPSERLDPNDPAAPTAALYWWLSYLLENVVEALSGGL
jgi:hypothetical protein